MEFYEFSKPIPWFGYEVTSPFQSKLLTDALQIY